MINKTIAFWSPYHGQACVTSNCAALAVFLSITKNLKSLIMHNNIKDTSLERLFLAPSQKGKSLLNENGIDALIKLIRSNQLHPSVISDYTDTILEERLELLQGSNKETALYADFLEKNIEGICCCAKASYDLVFFDSNPSLEPISLNTLKASDLIVVCLNQNMEVLRNYFNNYCDNEILREKEKIIVISNYEKSQYDLNYIRRNFLIKEDIFPVYHNVKLMEACNSHKVLEFFVKNYARKNSADIQNFFHGMDYISEAILYKLKIDYLAQSSQVKPVSFLKTLTQAFN